MDEFIETALLIKEQSEVIETTKRDLNKIKYCSKLMVGALNRLFSQQCFIENNSENLYKKLKEQAEQTLKASEDTLKSDLLTQEVKNLSLKQKEASSIFLKTPMEQTLKKLNDDLANQLEKDKDIIEKEVEELKKNLSPLKLVK